MIEFVQVVLLVGAVCGGGLALDLFEKSNIAGGLTAGILAIVGLAGVVAIELLVKR